MSTAPETHQGILRPRITLLDDSKTVIIEWCDVETDGVIWTEQITIPPARRAYSQIVCSGDFQTRPGFFVDNEGKRHFVVHAQPGVYSGLFG